LSKEKKLSSHTGQLGNLREQGENGNDTKDKEVKLRAVVLKSVSITARLRKW
jgi:hypothetical protein